MNKWIQLGSNINGEDRSNRFGHSVSISPNTNFISVGAPGNDEYGLDSGSVRLYKWDGNDWLQFGTDIDGREGDNLGKTVSSSWFIDGIYGGGRRYRQRTLWYL